MLDTARRGNLGKRVTVVSQVLTRVALWAHPQPLLHHPRLTQPSQLHSRSSSADSRISVSSSTCDFSAIVLGSKVAPVCLCNALCSRQIRIKHALSDCLNHQTEFDYCSYQRIPCVCNSHFAFFSLMMPQPEQPMQGMLASMSESCMHWRWLHPCPASPKLALFKTTLPETKD